VIVFFIRNTSSEAIAPNISQYQAHVRAKDRQLTITVALILLNYTVSWTLPSAVWAMFIVNLKIYFKKLNEFVLTLNLNYSASKKIAIKKKDL
jgi:hypothetical protein